MVIIENPKICVCVWSFVLVVWRHWWFFSWTTKGFRNLSYRMFIELKDLYLLLGCKIYLNASKKKTNIWIHLEYHTIWLCFTIYIYMVRTRPLGSLLFLVFEPEFPLGTFVRTSHIATLSKPSWQAWIKPDGPGWSSKTSDITRCPWRLTQIQGWPTPVVWETNRGHPVIFEIAGRHS